MQGQITDNGDEIMGACVNPQDQSKEQWLEQHATQIPEPPESIQGAVQDGKLPVGWVDNGAFTAAGIAYSDRELGAFTLPDDYRPQGLMPTLTMYGARGHQVRDKKLMDQLQQINRNQRLESFDLFHDYMAGTFTAPAFLRLFTDMLRRYDDERAHVRNRRRSLREG